LPARRYPRCETILCESHLRSAADNFTIRRMVHRGRIGKLDYEALAAFRYALRRFLRFSEEERGQPA